MHPKSFKPVFPHESTISTYMRYSFAVLSKFACAIANFQNKHSVLYARISHVSTRVVCIFHVRRVILKRSGLHSSLTRKWLVTGMPSPMLYANQIKIIAKKTPPGTLVSWRHSLFRASHGLMLVGGGGV